MRLSMQDDGCAKLEDQLHAMRLHQMGQSGWHLGRTQNLAWWYEWEGRSFKDTVTRPICKFYARGRCNHRGNPDECYSGSHPPWEVFSEIFKEAHNVSADGSCRHWIKHDCNTHIRPGHTKVKHHGEQAWICSYPHGPLEAFKEQFEEQARRSRKRVADMRPVRKERDTHDLPKPFPGLRVIAAPPLAHNEQELNVAGLHGMELQPFVPPEVDDGETGFMCDDSAKSLQVFSTCGCRKCLFHLRNIQEAINMTIFSAQHGYMKFFVRDEVTNEMKELRYNRHNGNLVE